MAFKFQDKESGLFHIGFRFNGRQIKRSLKTDDPREANAILGRVDETLLLIERGRLEVPPDVDPGTFILSDGKRGSEKKREQPLTVEELFSRYQNELTKGKKEESTLASERTHFKHLLRHLRARTRVQPLTVKDMQDYADRRSLDTWHDKPIRGETVKKELTTFRLVWRWAVKMGYLTGPSPVQDIDYANVNEKQIFRTSEEIERIISRGGISEEEVTELWEGLYLTREEVAGLLTHVEKTARYPFV